MRVAGWLVLVGLMGMVGCGGDSESQCSGDGDCAEGMTCNVTLNTCETPIPTGTCDTSSECIDDNAPVCVQEECVACNEDESGDTLCADKDESAPYCHLGACVECRGNDTCLGATAPICDADTCRGCQSHDECATGVCNDDGSCAAADTLIYLDPEHPNAKNTGAMGDVLCRADAPCTTFAAAVKQVAGTRDTILFRGVIKDETLTWLKPAMADLPEFMRVLGQDTEGARAAIANAIAEPLVAIRNAPHVVLENIEVRGGEAEGVLCQKSGTKPPVVKVELRNVVVNDNSIGVATNCDLSITSSTVVASDTMGISVTGGTLSMETSTVTGSGTFGVNTVGGTLSVVDSTISKNGTVGVQTDFTNFEIRNSVLVRNGVSSATSFGAAKLRGATGRFEFNTVAGNESRGAAGAPAGIACTEEVSLIATSNLFWNNRRIETEINVPASLGEKCVMAFSTVQDQSELDGERDGGNNAVIANPMFVDDAEDFHLQDPSPCRDKADPASTVKTDIDGDLRDEMPDVGADEYRP